MGRPFPQWAFSERKKDPLQEPGKLCQVSLLSSTRLLGMVTDLCKKGLRQAFQVLSRGSRGWPSSLRRRETHGLGLPHGVVINKTGGSLAFWPTKPQTHASPASSNILIQECPFANKIWTPFWLVFNKEKPKGNQAPGVPW